MSMLKNRTNFALTVTEVTNSDSVYGICLCVWWYTLYRLSVRHVRVNQAVGPNTLEITLTHCYK